MNFTHKYYIFSACVGGLNADRKVLMLLVLHKKSWDIMLL